MDNILHSMFWPVDKTGDNNIFKLRGIENLSYTEQLKILEIERWDFRRDTADIDIYHF